MPLPTPLPATPTRAQGHLSRTSTTDVDAVLDVVIPVHDEGTDLGPSVTRLDAFLAEHFPCTYAITIADHASTDGTTPRPTGG